VRTVCHAYCQPCFERLITTAIENEAQWPPKCCLNELPPVLITKHITAPIAKQYAARAAELGIPVDERLYCPFPNCGVFVPRRAVSAITKTARCPRGHSTCTICRQRAHGFRVPCPEDPDLLAATQLAQQEGWRRCQRCREMIEHREACQHMTCRCGAQFCYVCGAAWRTCACTMADLNRLKEAASQRRAQRTAAEVQATAAAEAEARELEEALRLVAEFEAEEFRRAEELAREMERLEEERLARELEERIRRETERRAEVAKKYASARAKLEELREHQNTILGHDHNGARDEQAKRAISSMAALKARHEEEASSQQAESEKTIAAYAAGWAADCDARVMLERELESQFAAALETHWVKRADGPARRAEALRTYQKRNDARWELYAAWRERKEADVRFRAGEELGIKTELRERERKQAEDAMAAEAEELGRRHVAERLWFGTVWTERSRLVGEMEMVETEFGGEEVEGSAAHVVGTGTEPAAGRRDSGVAVGAT
jgi:hypothetical protein